MVIINLAIASIFSYFVIFSLLSVFQCIPVESFWQQFSPKYNVEFYCLPESNAPVANAVFSIITDFVAALLPITLFTQIQLPRAQKVSLGVLFGVGFMYVVLTHPLLDYHTNIYRLCILGIAKAVFLHRTFFESYDANCMWSNVIPRYLQPLHPSPDSRHVWLLVAPCRAYQIL